MTQTSFTDAYRTRSIDSCLWKPGDVVAAQAPLRIDFCGMTDYIPCESWCVNAALGGLMTGLRIQARDDDQVCVDCGPYGMETFSLSDSDSGSMFAKAMKLHQYADRFDFGMDVKVHCEFGAVGLSSSSSVACAFNVALGLICGEPYDELALARQAQAIEPHWYGRQDQLATAFGGFNLWHMEPGEVINNMVMRFGRVDRYPINMPQNHLEELSSHSLLLYHSGIEDCCERTLSSIREKYHHSKQLQSAFEELNSLAQQVYVILAHSGRDMDWLGQLGEAFNSIRKTHEILHSSVSNQRTHDLFEAAARAGALGGRYAGAGGRGVLTFVCKPGTIDQVTAVLDQVSTPYEGRDGTVFHKGYPIGFESLGCSGARAHFAG